MQKERMNLYQIHGLLQFIAFCILYPLGAGIALFRDKIGIHWKTYHVLIQIIATMIVFIAIATIIYASKTQKKEKEEKKSFLVKLHTTLGPIVILVIVIQLFWAFFGKHFVSWDTWYTTHMMLSGCIILGGITNVLLGMNMVA
jgi:peptidoglycan biosynthesis protein MviN/MurJ (putative lipid II flippase)